MVFSKVSMLMMTISNRCTCIKISHNCLIDYKSEEFFTIDINNPSETG